tara:strand:+ start:2907 stop:3083 length:177 start_codon:yes stop_codon:yes gene_type:complete
MKNLREYQINTSAAKGQWLISARFGYDWDYYTCNIDSLRCVVPKLRVLGYVRGFKESD